MMTRINPTQEVIATLSSMSIRAIAMILLLAGPLIAVAQPELTISGTVRDKSNQEALIGATVRVEGTSKGTAADINGFYSLRLLPGAYRLVFNFVGFKSTVKAVQVTGNLTLDADLEAEDTELEEIVVQAERDNSHVEDIQMSKSKVNMLMVRKLPTVLGEVDIIKAVQAMPGVISAGEGTSSFFVRGGSADQNLILMDGAPIYDASHLFGLYSVFNADIVKDAELYKGGVPTKFGGRLSSILDVQTKDPASGQTIVGGGIGTLASRVMAEGALSDKISYFASARRSYADVFMRLAQQKNAASFYDLNGKLMLRASQGDQVSLSLYRGRDNFDFDKRFDFSWGNTAGVLDWKHAFNDRVFSKTSLIVGSFDYLLRSEDEANPFQWKSSVNQAGLQYDVVVFAGGRHEINLGYKASYLWFEPGTIASTARTGSFRSIQMDRHQAIDQAIYVDTRHRLSDRLTLWYGLRLSMFRNVGPSDVIRYAGPTASGQWMRMDTLRVGHLETVKSFGNLEPRFSARYLLGEQSSLKASYSRMVQNVHSISNGTVPLPFNTWLPSGFHLRPQWADLWAIGYFHTWQSKPVEWSVEAFYKDMSQVTEFTDNANLFFNPDLVMEVRQGKSWSYGVEFSLTKTKGKFTGQLNYTWSTAMREIPGVNQGIAYAANHDRRHVLNLSGVYEINDRWTIASQFSYSTGRPITVTSGRYEFGNFDADIITERNGYRLPAVHRLDVAVTYTPKANKNRKWKGEWVFSVYNVYSRKNPFTLYTRSVLDKSGNLVGDGSTKEARMISLFPIIPSVTYNFKF
ncbi:MAG: TonB-dependent receptor [Cyclobacteriaceae bacterium]|nr:TonB-dependent receptor [Cyclobacteriaceae bacterium]